MCIYIYIYIKAGQLRAELEALQHTVAELEKERDFYYGKLRSVELLCQTTEESPQGTYLYTQHALFICGA